MGWTAQVTTRDQHGLADSSINYTAVAYCKCTALQHDGTLLRQTSSSRAVFTNVGDLVLTMQVLTSFLSCHFPLFSDANSVNISLVRHLVTNSSIHIGTTVFMDT